MVIANFLKIISMVNIASWKGKTMELYLAFELLTVLSAGSGHNTRLILKAENMNFGRIPMEHYLCMNHPQASRISKPY